MPKQNSIILACFIIPVLLSGCGIKGPLTQKPAPEKSQKQNKNAKTEQKQTVPAQPMQEN